MGLNFAVFMDQSVNISSRDGQRLCNYIANCEIINTNATKIGNLGKFNPAKIKVYTVILC